MSKAAFHFSPKLRQSPVQLYHLCSKRVFLVLFKVQSDRGWKPYLSAGTIGMLSFPLTLCQHHLHSCRHALPGGCCSSSHQRLKKSSCFGSVTERQPGSCAARSHDCEVSILQHSNLSHRLRLCEASTSSGPTTCIQEFGIPAWNSWTPVHYGLCKMSMHGYNHQSCVPQRYAWRQAQRQCSAAPASPSQTGPSLAG